MADLTQGRRSTDQRPSILFTPPTVSPPLESAFKHLSAPTSRARRQVLNMETAALGEQPFVFSISAKGGRTISAHPLHENNLDINDSRPVERATHSSALTAVRRSFRNVRVGGRGIAPTSVVTRRSRGCHERPRHDPPPETDALRLEEA